MHKPTLILAVFCAASVSGCDAVTKGFNEGFDKSFREECIKGASEKGVPAAMSKQLCDCMMDDLAKDRKEGSVMVPSTPRIEAAAKKCTANIDLPEMK